jgi:anti-anti-sigma factor
MRPLARVLVERGDDVSIAAVEGEVDVSNVAGVGGRLRELVTNRSTALVVDLTDTTYLESAGINLLFALAAELDHRQQRLRLVVAPSSQIARVMGDGRDAGRRLAAPDAHSRARAGALTAGGVVSACMLVDGSSTMSESYDALGEGAHFGSMRECRTHLHRDRHS